MTTFSVLRSACAGLVVALVLVAFTSASVSAQSDRAEKRVRALSKSLSLTPEQVTKVRAIVEKMEIQLAEAREQNGNDRKGMRTLMRTKTDESNKEIEALLTPAQQKKFEKVKRERRREIGGGQRGRTSRE